MTKNAAGMYLQTIIGTITIEVESKIATPLAVMNIQSVADVGEILYLVLEVAQNRPRCKPNAPLLNCLLAHGHRVQFSSHLLSN
jgi:hypothetical protein